MPEIAISPLCGGKIWAQPDRLPAYSMAPKICRLQIGWEAVPGDSGQRNQIYLLEIAVERV